MRRERVDIERILPIPLPDPPPTEKPPTYIITLISPLQTPHFLGIHVQLTKSLTYKEIIELHDGYAGC